MKNKELWITGAIVVSQNENRDVYKKNIRILNNQIVEITAKKPKPNAKIIDASGFTVLPGFIQTHVHLCQTLFRGLADDLELLDWLKQKIWPFEASHTEDTLLTSALLGIDELLSTGTTTILDMGTVRHTKSIFEAVKTTGIRASVGKCLMDHPGQNPSYLQEKTGTALKEAFDLFEKYDGSFNGRLRVSLAPRFAISCTDRLLKEVSVYAKQKGVLIHTHASENRGEIDLVKKITGMGNIPYLEKVGLFDSGCALAHGVWLDQNDFKILKRKEVGIVHCPSSNLKLASGFAPVPELLDHGICVGLGADGAPCNNQLNMFQEMKLAGLMHKPKHGPRAMNPVKVLDMATRNGAKILKMQSEIGSVEEGKKADLIALRLGTLRNPILNPAELSSIAACLVYSTDATHLEWTMVDGKLVYERSRGSKADQLLPRLEKARKMILQRSVRYL